MGALTGLAWTPHCDGGRIVHVLVATDGKLDAELAARFAAPLAGPEGQVTALTVVEIPRRLLADLRSVFGEMPATHVDSDAEYVGVGDAGHDPVGWPGDDAIIKRYLGDKLSERCGPLAEALRDSGVATTTKVVEGEHPAKVIVEMAAEIEADVCVIGAHGQGLFEGLLGSVGTKVTRQAECPVLVMR